MKHIMFLIIILCLCAGCINNDIDPLISGGNEYASYVWTIQDTLQRITVSLNPDSLQYREWVFDYGVFESSVLVSIFLYYDGDPHYNQFYLKEPNGIWFTNEVFIDSLNPVLDFHRDFDMINDSLRLYVACNLLIRFDNLIAIP